MGDDVPLFANFEGAKKNLSSGDPGPGVDDADVSSDG